MRPMQRETNHAQKPTAEDRHEELLRRIDDLKGMGLHPVDGSDADGVHDGSFQELSLSLIDLLESSQRRVIETSIQLLSLRELVSDLLNMRTPDAVAKTVALYLHKAFDHERVMVGVWDEDEEALRGWVAVRRGSPRCSSFELTGSWSGNIRSLLQSDSPRSSSHRELRGALIDGSEVPLVLKPFTSKAIGPYFVHPLVGAQQKILGVLVVGRERDTVEMDDMDTEILKSLMESITTALENVVLDEDVRREEAFRKDIMGSMASGLVAVNLNGELLTMNQRAEVMLGSRLEEIKGTSTTALGTGEGSIHQLLRSTVHDRRGMPRTESILQRSNGKSLPVAVMTAPLLNPERQVYGAIATLEDLTTMKAMEERIRQLDRLAALGRFTAGVAHEIRNPLAGIAAGVQYLSKHVMGLPDQETNLEFIRREIERLNRIVEDLFQVTHPTPPRKAPENPKRLVELSLRCLGGLPKESGVEVTMDIPEDIPDVPVDPDQIQQVLINLIKNAIEATPSGGGVTISGRVEEAQGEPNLVLQVEDTGPGIEAGSLPHIFEPFFTKGKAGGTGLGLYVSHGVAERHGGELIASNGSKHGAVFALKLPLTFFDTMEMAG